MADIQSNIQVNIDTSEALASIKLLQKQISAFHTSMAKSGAAAAAASSNLQQNLINSINSTGKFSAEMRTVKTSTESFTSALEKNKLTMREYYRYAGASTKSFGRFFKSEFDTINKVARERVKDLQTQYIKMGRDANGAMKAIAIRPLALDMKDLGTQTAIAAQRQQLLNQLLKQGSTNLLNFGKNTQWAGRQLMVGFTIPLMYLGTAASKTFMKLEEQAIRFKRVYGEMFTAQSETDAMLKDIQLLAKEFTKYGVAVEDTMKMAADAAAQGKMGADLLAQVNEATRLAVLGGVEQEQALETTISLTNAFGIAADQLTGKINFLNAVENQTVTSIEDLTTAIPKAGPVVKQLGGDVEDLAFFLTAMKEGGINASEGANALKSGLASLINPTAKASSMLAGFGINIKGIVEANKGNVKGIVVDFAKALDTLDPLNRAQAIEQLFGKFQFARLSTLFQNVIKEGTQASRVLKLTNATTEELAILSEREMKRIEDSPMYKFKKSVEDLKVTLAPVGGEFLKAITPIVEFFSKILDKFNSLGDGAKSFVVILTTVLAGIGPVALMTFGLLANGIANIIKLFTSVKSIFNRAGAATTDLGAQTSYMTQEQLRAASVAASLDQVHNKLTQSFTSEANAINSLVAAYRRAIAAQSAFVPGRGGIVPGKGPKKFNTGTVGVRYYAQGTDTVPAMLTPGEAVIPAGPAQDPANKPFIKHMVAGGIIGQYEIGTTSVNKMGKGFKNATIYFPESWNTEMGGRGQGVPAANVTSYLSKAGGAAAAPLLAVMAKSMGMNINDPKVKAQWASIGQQLITSATTAINQSGRQFIKDEDLEEILVPAFKKTAANLSVAGKGVATALNNAVNQIHTVGQVGTQSGTKAGAGRTALSRFSYRAIRAQSQKFAMSENPNMFGIQQRFSKSRQKFVNSFQTFDPVLKKWEVATMSHITKSVTTTVSDLINRVRPYLGDQSERIVKATTKSIVDGVKKQAKVASPSKETQRVGKEIGKGAVIGVQEYVDDAKVAGQKLGTAVVDGTQARRAASKTALYGAGPTDATQKSLRRQLQKQEKLNKLAEKAAYKQTQVTGMVAGGVGGQGGGGRGRFMDRFRRQPNPDGTPRQGMGMGGGMMAASGILMAASMAPGKVGETAQKLMMPVMALTMLLPLLTNPIGALVVGFGVLAAGAIKLRMAFDSAQDSAMKLAETTGSGEKAIRDLSKFAGTVSAGEIMDRRRKESLTPFEIKTGKTTYGESYVQSETGKALIANLGDSIKNVGKASAQDQLVNQMATSVISGVISGAQARSIIASIGEKIGDYGFSINANAKLTSLIGANGENLLKDPINIKVRLIEETRGKAGLSANAAMNAGSLVDAFKKTNKDFGTMDKILDEITFGIWGGYKVNKNRNENLGQASGATVSMQKIALEQQQEMLDSLDLDYQKRIDSAKAANDQVTAEKLTNEYLVARQKLLAQNQITVEKIQSTFAKTEGATKKALMTGVDKAITAKYKGTALEDVAGLAKTQIGESGIDEDKQYTLKLQLATGNIQPMQMLSIIDLFGKDKGAINKVLNIIAKFGGTTANQAMSVAGMFTNKNGKPNKVVQTKFIAQVSAAGDSEEANKIIEFYNKVAQTGNVLNTDIIVGVLQKDPALAAKLQKQLDEVTALKGPITVQIVSEILNKDQLAALNDDLAYFSSLKDEQKKIYLQTLITTMQTVSGSDPAFQNWLKAEGSAWNSPMVQPGVKLQKYVIWNSQRVTDTSTLASAKIGGGTPGAGSKVQTSPLDDLLKKLRDVRKLQIQVTEGWDASMKKLKEVFGGNKEIQVFNGLEQSLRRLGAGENLIELIIGMDPKEYEKRKKSLFKFDNKGNIISLKQDAVVIQKALSSIVLGDFQSNLEKQTIELKNQNLAFDKLSKLGVPVANAYEIINDATLAAAIANATNEKSLIALINKYKALEAAKKKATAVQNVRTDIAQANKDLAQEQRLQTQYSYLDAFAINSDENLKALEQAIQDQKAALANAIKNAQDERTIFAAQAELNRLTNDFNTRLSQLKQTIGYMQNVFDDGFNKAMEWFDAQEKSIQLDFQLGTDVSGKNTVSQALADLYKGTPVFMGPDGKAITKFTLEADAKNIEKYEDQVALLQYQIDDWEYSLTEIEDQEKLIGEEYDARVNALDEIQKLNSRISAQQKSQLTLADALSQGDIAAAAKAAQEMRSQAAQNAIDDQRTALDQAKENALANIRNSQGFTRVQIEEKIKGLQTEIAKIEEQQLEPARERLRIAEKLQKDAIDSLTVLGKSKTQWEQVKNSIDLARTSSAAYMEAMQAALDMVDKIIQYWKNIPKRVDTQHVITTTYVTNPGTTPPGTTPPGTTPPGTTPPGTTPPGITPPVTTTPGTTTPPSSVTGGIGIGSSKDEKDLGTAPYGRINGIVAPSGIIPSVVYNHLYDLGNIAEDIDKNTEIFTQKMNVLAATKEAGSTAGLFLAEQYSKSNALAAANADKAASSVTALQKSIDAAAANAKNQNPTAGNTDTLQNRILDSMGFRARGGIIPKRFAWGGKAMGTDTVPAMLTPGEFIVRRYAVNDFGLDNLKAINNGTYEPGSVYNYDLTVNVQSNSNPDQIANVVMSKIRQVESMKVRGNRL